MKNKLIQDNQNVCNAGEFFLASVLSANGFITTITHGRAERYDILTINPNKKAIKIQVKTLKGDGVQWRMSPKDEKNSEKDLWYAFVRLNNLYTNITSVPQFWIVPSKVVTEYVKSNHINWLKSPGKNGQKHNSTDTRTFRVKIDKYTPKDWTKKCEKYYLNIKPLINFK